MSDLSTSESSGTNSQTVVEFETLINDELNSEISETEKEVSSSDSDDSTSSNGDSSSEDESIPTYGIYLHSTLIFSKQKSDLINDNVRHECKIIKFGSEWIISEMIKQIKSLNEEDFPNLSVAIVELSDIGLFNQRNKSKSNIILYNNITYNIKNNITYKEKKMPSL